MASTVKHVNTCYAACPPTKAACIKTELCSSQVNFTKNQSGKQFTHTIHGQIHREIQMEMMNSDEYEDGISEWDMDEDEEQSIRSWIDRCQTPFESITKSMTNATSTTSPREIHGYDSPVKTVPKARKPPKIVFGDSRYRRKARLRRKEREQDTMAQRRDCMSPGVESERC